MDNGSAPVSANRLNHLTLSAGRELRIRFEDLSGPRAEMPCRFTPDDGDEAEAVVTEQGILPLTISRRTSSVEIRLYPDTEIEELYTINIEPLDPIEEDAGLQERLTHLGYDCGNGNGNGAEQTRAAVEEFQRLHELEPTGEADEALLELLRQEHGV